MFAEKRLNQSVYTKSQQLTISLFVRIYYVCKYDLEHGFTDTIPESRTTKILTVPRMFEAFSAINFETNRLKYLPGVWIRLWRIFSNQLRVIKSLD